MKKALLVPVIFFCIFSLYAENLRVAVNTGHNSPVNTIVWDETSGFLFSGGDDGVVHIWNPDTKDIVDTIQVTHLSIIKLSVNPVEPQIAVLETDSINTFKLSVWDWRKKERLYTRVLKEDPLFLKFSPQGSFVVYGETDWQSLTFLNSLTGFRLPYLQQGFGIISFVEISTSENTIMTYNASSGMITYWDLQVNSRKPKLQVQSIPDLTSISMITKRYMIGAANDEIVVIDAVTGEKTASYFQPNIRKIEVNPLNGDIICYGYSDEEPFLTLLQYFQRSLIKNYYNPRNISASINDFTFYNNRLFAADESGEIMYYLPVSGTRLNFSDRNLLEISDIAFSDNSMHIATENTILTLTSDFFSKNLLGAPDVTYVREKYFSNPLQTAIGLETYYGGDLLLWKKSDEPGVFTSFNPYSGFTKLKYENFGFPLLSFDFIERTIITLEDDGTIRLINPATEAVEFQYSSIGIQSVILIPGKAIVAGKNVTNSYESPMLHINPYTGETIGIEDPVFILYDLTYDSRKDVLYSLSLRRSRDIAFTEIKAHYGERYETADKIISYNLPDLEGDLIVDTASSNLYTSAGYSGVRMWDGKTSMNFEKVDHIPRKLFLDKNYLYSLNRNGSISIWFKGSGKHLLDFYIFEDLGWLGVTKTGLYFTDSARKGERHITIYDDDYVASDESESLELEIFERSNQIRGMDWQ